MMGCTVRNRPAAARLPVQALYRVGRAEQLESLSSHFILKNREIGDFRYPTVHPKSPGTGHPRNLRLYQKRLNRQGPHLTWVPVLSAPESCLGCGIPTQRQ